MIRKKIALDNLRNSISEGDYNTMLFMMQNIVKGFEKLKEYETAGNIREAYLTYHNCLDDLKKRPIIFCPIKLEFSGELFFQILIVPYNHTVSKSPKILIEIKKYPLFVMLHGSGSDDQSMLYEDELLTENNFIEVAPYGRGTFKLFF